MKALPLLAIGRTFFAIALLGLGAEHILFQEFVTGRAPAWPAGLAGKQLWMSGTGVLVGAAGGLLVMRRWDRQAMLGLALLVFLWALLRHVPVVAGDALLAGSWTRAGKALTIVGGALAMAGAVPKFPNGDVDRFASATDGLVRLGAICLGCSLIVSGLQHFKFTPFVVTLIPPWFPGDHTFLARFAGVALVAGGVGLIVKQTMKVTGLLVGLMLFSWFWIVHLRRTFTSVSDGIALFESLAFSGIAFAIAGASVGDVIRTGRITSPLTTMR